MTSVDLTIGESDFGIEFDMVDEGTGGAFNLLGFGDIRLFIVSTDFATQQIPGGVVLQVVGVVQNGILNWDVQGSQIPSVSDQYYGIIVMTNGTSGETRKSRRFNIKVSEAVST